MQLIWVTDPHLNFVNHDVWDAWTNSLRLIAGNRLLITGDITEADDLAWQLTRIQQKLDMPIYFVLGNHDFYGSRVAKVREEMRQLTATQPQMVYLSAGTVVPLEDGWVLVGDDGWADAGFGDALASRVRLNDFRRIDDYRGMELSEDLEVMRSLAIQSADGMRQSLADACQQSQRILIATHVPPFREACWYQGKVTDDDWAPYFASRVMGEVLLAFANLYPGHLFHVLCGHTHNAGTARIAPNLTVWTGGAEYGRPAIQDVLELGELSECVRKIN
jgi:3',5'-cyclic-AMP phosphodiesterase